MSMYKTGEIYDIMTTFEKHADGRTDREKDKNKRKITVILI
jgi:hypothetical protein